MEKVVTVIVGSNMSLETEHGAVDKYLKDGYSVKSITACPSSTDPFTTIIFLLDKR